MSRTLITISSSNEDERKDIAHRIYTLCLAIGKVTKHFKKESNASPLPTDANVIIIEKESE